MSLIMNQSIRSTVSEHRESRELIHYYLHRNIQLLNLKHPMSNDLSNCFQEGMLKNPNSTGFNQLAYYLMTVIDEKYITSDMSYYLCEPKMASQFRREFLKFVNDIAKIHKGYLSPIMPSWLVTAGGYKVAKLMFELSQVALKANIIKIKSNTIIKENIDELSDDDLLELKNKLSDKISLWYQKSTNTDQIYELLNNEINDINIDIDSKKKILTNFINNTKKCVDNEMHDELDKVLDTMSPSNLIISWSNYIDQKINLLENDWNRSYEKIGSSINNCKQTSGEIIQRYTKKSIKSTLLEYNKEKDKFDSESCVDSKELNLLLKEMVRGDVLHLPTLFRAYNMVLLYNFGELSLFKIDTKYCDKIKEKKSEMDSKQIQFKQLESEIDKIYMELKIARKVDLIQNNISEEDKWIYEALNIPSMNSLT